MHRRDFLRTLTATALAGNTFCSLTDQNAQANEPAQSQAMTVTGGIDPAKLGTVLPHEHVMVDFVGADEVSRDRYDRDQVFRTVLPHLKEVRRKGCDTLVECTPAYLGRDAVLLKQLSEASGMQIITNTGYYGARDGTFLPEHAHEESPNQLAGRWLDEWKKGIEDTAIRPGFIKIGVDNGPLRKVNQKLVQAAARTHLESGLAIACHTGDGAAAMQEISILKDEGVDLSAWIWVHAQNERNTDLHRRAAEQGGWVEFDGIRTNSIDLHVRLVQNMKEHNLLDHVLLSHDAGWYSVGQTDGGDFRRYTALFDEFLPALKQADFEEEEIQLLTVTNPARAFAVRVRNR